MAILQRIENVLSLSDVRLVALSTMYLLIHPGGVHTEKLCTYINEQSDPNSPDDTLRVEVKQLNEILSKCECIFSCEKIKCDDQIAQNVQNLKDQEKSISMIWKYCGLSRN